MKRILTGFISTLFFFSMQAQDKLGIANSNYSSTNSIFLNPSSSVDSRAFIQLNLIGVNLYLMNNQVFVPDLFLWSAVKGNVQTPALSTMPMNKFVYTKIDIDGPALVVSNQEIGIGFFTKARAVIDIRNIPNSLTKLLSQHTIDTTQSNFDLNIRNAKLSEMAWVEYGLNFGKMIRKRGDVMMTVGVNAKYLTGINIAYLDLQRLDVHLDKTHIDINNLKGKVRFDTTGWNTGQGFGTDIGFTYKKMIKWVDSYYANSKKSNCTYIDYKYKLGISLLDLGTIRFNQNTFKGDISGSSHVGVNNYNNAQASAVFNSNYKTSEQINSPIWASLPTALSMQGDLNLSYYFGWEKDRHLYLNATALQSVTTIGTVGVQAQSLLSVAPRFEVKNVEVSVPVTFQRYLYPQVGLAVRVRTFVFGLDNALPVFMRKDTYGVGVYFGIGVSMFKNPTCRAKRVRHHLLQKVIDASPYLTHVQNRAKENKLERVEQKKKNQKIADCPKLAAPDMVDQKEVDKAARKKRRPVRNWFRRKKEKAPEANSPAP
jgi:hypothetical protein